MASPQCVTSSVSSGPQTARSAIHTENICIPSPHCESVYVSLGYWTLRRTSHNEGSQKYSHKCVFWLHNRKKDFHTEDSHIISLRY